MSSALAPVIDDIRALLAKVADTDLGTLTLRREELKRTLRDKRYDLDNHRWVSAPQRMTETQLTDALQRATKGLREAEARLPVIESVITKFEEFTTHLTAPEKEEMERRYSISNIRYERDYVANTIRNYQSELARLGEPEPEWVDPRIAIAQQIATLEMALKEVNKAIKEKQNA